MSYGEDNFIDFTESGVTQLIGANGAGKSSLSVILEEALYNKNSRGVSKKDLPNRYTDKSDYHIKVTFDANGSEYVIEKIVKSTAKVKLYKDGEDISGHTATQTYGLIEGIIGTDFNTFTKLINQSMSSSLDFLTATDTNRKKFLIDLIGLEFYSKMETKTKSELKEVSTKLTEVLTSRKHVESELEKAKETAALPLKDVPQNVDDYVEALSDKMGDIKALEARKSELVSFNNKISVHNRLVDKYEQHLRLEPHAPASMEKIKVDTSKLELMQLQSEIARCKQEIVKYQNIKTECFTCKRPFDDVPDMSAEISDLREKISVMESQVSELNKQIAIDLEFNKEIDSWLAYKSENAKLLRDLDNQPHKKDLESLESLNQQILEIQSEVSQLRNKHEELKRAAEDSKVHNMKVVFAKEKVEELQDKLGEYETDEISRDVADLTLLKEVFSNKGLVAYKIESSIKVFEKLINEYLAELSKGQFALSFEVNESKLQVILYDDGHRINIKSASSGELNKINTATLLAVRKLMSAVAKVNINLLFIDEVSSVLDGPSRDELTELVLGERHLNTMMVTHEYTHPLTSKLHVVKEGKISRIENGE